MPTKKKSLSSDSGSRSSSQLTRTMEELEDIVRSRDLYSVTEQVDKLSNDDIKAASKQPDNPIYVALEIEEEEICLYLFERGFSGLKEGTDIQAMRNKNPERNLWDKASSLPKIQQWIYEIVTGARKPGERKPGVALGLERLVKKGNKLAIKSLLKDVKEVKDAQNIESQFEYRDPVYLAALHGHEDIAVMLIDMGFSFDKTHRQVGLPGSDQEKWQTISTFDEATKLPKVKEIIDEIQSGKRKHGEALKPKPRPAAPKKAEDPKVTKNMERAKQLQTLITKNDLNGIEKLLDCSDQDMIWGISSQYKLDPVMQAVEDKREEIAMYLVEKGFNFGTPHFTDGKKYTSVDVARENHLLSFCKLAEDINSGSRKPGDGLHDRWSEFSRELQQAILSGDSRDVKKLLDDVTDDGHIKRIESNFPDRDPVVFAIDNREEYVALYLIEKGFNFVKWYQWPGQRCDQWCYFEHQCPAEYSAMELATKKDLPHVVSLIQNIQSGNRKPGDGLPELQNPNIPSKEAPGKKNDTKGIASSDSSLYKTRTAEARSKAQKLGAGFLSKNGDTLLHLAVEDGPPLAFVSANMGVPVNAQNFDGNTALHLAAHRDRLVIAKALLMCGADLTIRNKLGQTPIDGTSGNMKKMLERFKPGLPKVIQKADSAGLLRLLKMWCNPYSNIADGKSAVDLLNAKKNKSKEAQKCHSVLQHHLSNLELVHAVLSEDMTKLKSMLRKDKKGEININVRFKDKKGESPLSCAIALYNLEIIQLLVDTGRCQCNIRVPDREMSESTIPVIFRTLETDCPIEIWKYLKDHCKQNSEKDQLGNTPMLRAISSGKPASYIADMIKFDGGVCLCDRNKDGLLPRELALELEKHDVVAVIDQFILDSPGNYFLKTLPQNFYGQKNMDLRDENGRTLLDIASTQGKDEDVLAVRDYAKVEDLACKLFKAVQEGDFSKSADLNTMNYRDMNGYNALHRAIAFGQLQVARVLITSRPGLKSMGDNCNRYPLHYAYALPDEEGLPFVKLLLQGDADKIEHLVDKDGREPAEYKDLRDDAEVLKMMVDVRTLDPYGKKMKIQ